jgi:MYXO-CTERM domain-containing protein
LRVTCAAVLALGATLVAEPARAAGTWTQAPQTSGGAAFGLWLLTDGTVLAHNGMGLTQWAILTPDKTGSYINGTWKNVASSAHGRGGAQQHILKDGRFFQAGGEYVDGPACTPALCTGVDIYDPVADKWTTGASAPLDVGDTGSATLADGRILDSTRNGNQTQIYDPAKDMWTMGGAGGAMPLKSGDESAWASLQNGGVLAVGYQTDGAAIYDPATDKWIRTGPVPSGFNTGDTGGISLMYDGRVFVYGLGQSYIYTPGATAADPGTWALGPMLLNGDRAEDEYSDTLPNGKVWGALVQMTYGPGVVLQEFDPMTNTVSSVTPPPDTGNPYPIDYVNLPNGQTMVTCANADWIYTPDTLPQDAWRPTVTSVTYDGSGTYTLTGTQLSGLVNGADEGDDMTMAENYPIVWLTDESGNVYYCRSFNFSKMMPSPGNTPETCQFTTPAGLPNGTYSLYVSAVGVQSKDGVSFTTGVGGSGSGNGDAGAINADAGHQSDGAISGDASSSTSGNSSSGGSTGDAGGGSSSGGGSGGHGTADAGSAASGVPSGNGLGGGGVADGGARGNGANSSGSTSGCGCSAVGEVSSIPSWAALLWLAGLGATVARRRPRRID